MGEMEERAKTQMSCIQMADQEVQEEMEARAELAGKIRLER
jgi:hypothetical protein